MKTLKKLIAGLMIFIPGVALSQIIPAPSAGGGSGNSYSGNLIGPVNIANTNTTIAPSIDLSKYDASKVSAQVLFSTVTFTPLTFQDGAQSTGTVNVLSYTSLSSAAATDQVTITSNAFTTVPALTVGNYVLTMGQQWAKGANNVASAVNLAAAINVLPNFRAASISNVVYATATYGSYANFINFTSNNSSMTVNTAQMSGGADNAVLTINGVALTQGVQWTAGTSSYVTAKSIASAINTAFSTLQSTSNLSGALVFTTSTYNGAIYNYSIVSSTPTALSVPPTGFLTGGITPTFTLGSGLFSTSTASAYPQGLAVLLSSGPTSLNVGGLTGQTTYFYYPITATTYDLVNYATSAIAGAPLTDFVSITSTNSSPTNHIYTLTPLAWGTQASTFTWQASNDNLSWFTAYSTSGVTTATLVTPTVPSTPGNIVPQDFGSFNFRYLRLLFQGNTTGTGAINLSVPMNLKQDGIGRF